MNAISLNRVLNTNSVRLPGIPHSESAHNHEQTSGVTDSKPVVSRPEVASDSVEISAEGRAKAEQTQRSGKTKELSAGNLSAEEKAQVQELQKIDRQTRAHEQAHLGASGGLARGGASFTFTKGPDGRLYAVGGEVSIDTSPVPGDPDATIRKADTIRRAALAPSEPSSQDKAVAAQAAKMANEARSEKLKNKQSESTEGAEKSEIEGKFNPSAALGDLLDLVV